MEKIKEIPTVIIGGGPAGLAASIQLKRFGISHILFEREKLGGLARNANCIENYPAIPGGISGEEFVERLENQARSNNLPVILEEVTRLDFKENKFLIEAGGIVTKCLTALIASGTQPKVPDSVKGIDTAGERVQYDVQHFRNISGCKIGIIGAGDAAFDYALNLSRRNFIWIFNRNSRTRCLPALFEAAGECPKIHYLSEKNLVEVSGNGSEICAHFISDLQREIHYLDYLIFAVGRIPSREYFSDSLKEREDKLKSEGRLYFAGDIVNSLHRQAVIAAGDGLRAAMGIRDYFNGK